MVETANGKGYGNGSEMVGRTDQHPQGTVGDLDGGRTRKLMGLTRNAVIGKANRLHLPRKKPSGKRQEETAAGRSPDQAAGLLRPDVADARHRTRFPRADDRRDPIDECHYPARRRGHVDHVLRPTRGGRRPTAPPIASCVATRSRRGAMHYNDFMNFRGVR